MESTLKASDSYQKCDIKSSNKKSALDDVDKLLLRPMEYFVSASGKHFGQNIIETLNYWMDVPKEKLEIITEIIYNFRNFSLLIDDIQDNSALRRGIPTAHTVFGVVNTVMAANAAAVINLEKASELDHPEVLRVYTNSLLQMLVGQGMEIYWRDNFTCPTEEEYFEMAARKTGGIFHLVKNIMQLFSATNKHLDTFLTNIGLYFQINDDYQNLKSQVFFDSKGFCEDLTEGKFSFPLVHAINTDPEKGKLILNIMTDRATTVELKKRCLSLMQACGSFEYTRNKIEELKRAIVEDIIKLGGNPFMNSLFEKIISASA